MKILSSGSTDKGKTRKNNEDAFLIESGIKLYAVADGIGGHEGGEVASRMAVETLREVIREHVSGKANSPELDIPHGADPADSALSHAFKLANVKIREAGNRDPLLSGMGTTLTAALLTGKSVRLAHVGDSRAYLLRAGFFDQLTDDHGVVAEQVRAGLITAEQARRSPYRHVITRALGIEPDLVVDLRTVELRGNDMLLLCTDGLTEMIDDPGIARILSNAADPQEAAEKLVAVANDRGGVDNITVVVIKVEEIG